MEGKGFLGVEKGRCWGKECTRASLPRSVGYLDDFRGMPHAPAAGGRGGTFPEERKAQPHASGVAACKPTTRETGPDARRTAAGSHSKDEIFDQISVNVRQSEVASLIAVGEACVLHAHEMQNGGV